MNDQERLRLRTLEVRVLWLTRTLWAVILANTGVALALRLL